MLLYIEILSNVVLKFPLCRSDGQSLTFATQKNAGPFASAPKSQFAEGSPYIGNRNTMKFHSAACPSVNDMNEENKVTIATREEALALGYAPCKRCNP